VSGTVTSITGTIGASGRVNTPPATINANILALAETYSPGLTGNLPGTFISDVLGTDTAAIVVADQAVTETIASISPSTANAYLLTLFGGVYLGVGSTAAPPTNTAVYVVFTAGGATAGVLISPGFTVSDGTYQYTVQDGGVTLTGGSTQPLYCLATTTGSWAVPAATVTQLVTSAPTGYTLTCTNPLAGTPGGAAQTQAQYRSQVVQAGLVAATGMPNMLRTLLQQVPGVNPILISIRTPSANKWEIIVGGTGDAYAIGAAIYAAIADPSTLVGSTLGVLSATLANPCVITTTLNHGYTGTQAVVIAGATGLTAINGSFTATVLTQNTFSIPVNTSSGSAYTGGGVVTPNFRNVSITINDYPDSYTIPFVIPPLQTVTMTITWNTSSLNYVSPTAIAGFVQPAIALYINSIPVGAPINTLDMTSIFQTAVAALIPIALLTRLVFTVSINGIVTAPGSGTGIINGDPESYFTCVGASVTVVQG